MNPALRDHFEGFVGVMCGTDMIADTLGPGGIMFARCGPSRICGGFCEDL